MTLPAPPSSHPPVIVMSHPEGAYTTCRTSSEGGKCWIAESTQALCIDCGVCLVASQPTRGRSPSRLQYDVEPCQLPCPRSLGRPSQRTAGALLESAQAEHQVRACVPRLPPQGLVLSLSRAAHSSHQVVGDRRSSAKTIRVGYERMHVWIWAISLTLSHSQYVSVVAMGRHNYRYYYLT